MTGLARVFRGELADALDHAGPDAPTLCTGWTTADLAAHVVLRERRPDAAAGIMIKPLAGWNAHVLGTLRDKTPYARLVEQVRSGPPLWSPFTIAAIDAAANTIEFYIHLQDVVRAQPGWAPEPLTLEQDEDLWSRLRRGAKLMFRSAPVGVTLVSTGAPGTPRRTVVAKAATPLMVTVTGDVGDLIMFASGRKEAAQVELHGADDAIARLHKAKLGI